MTRALQLALPRIAAPSPGILRGLWALPALGLGLLIARLPAEISVGLLTAGVLCGLALWEPVIGLGLAMALGPTKALLATARPDLPADLGQVFFALAAAGWLARGLARRDLHVPRIGLLVPLGIYLFVGLASLLAASSLEEGLKEALKWAEVMLGLVIFIAEAERGRTAWIVAGLLAAGLLQATIGIWQFAFRPTGPEHFRILGGNFRAYGTFEQPNPYAGFLGLIWPVLAGLAWGLVRPAHVRRNLANLTNALLRRGRFRLSLHWSGFGLCAGGAALCLAGLYMSFSRGAWLGAAAAALAMMIFLPRRLGVGLGLTLAALAASWGLAQAGVLPASLTSRLADVADFVRLTDVRGALITNTNFSIIERLAHWQAAVSMAQAHPWLGVGLGNYSAAYPDFQLLNWPNALGHAHMVYLNVLAESGLLGLGAYVFLWSWVIGLTVRLLRRTEGVWRGLALGLLGAWAHLSAHQAFDYLYVNNIHFTLAALLALLAIGASLPTRKGCRP